MARERKPMYMIDMTVEELRRALRRTRTALLPCGLSEQHGYHLPLGTDIINAERLAGGIAERYPCVVAPTVNYSFSGGMLPGTINVHPHVCTQLIEGIILSLYHQGFRRVVIVPGHAGSESVDAVKESLRFFHWLHPDHDDLQVLFLPAWEFSPTWKEGFDAQDYHAAMIETSLLLYWCPEKVRSRIVMDVKPIAEMLREDPDSYQQLTTETDCPYEIPHTTQREEIKVGIMGWPERASAELGRKVSDEAVGGMVKLLRSLDRKPRRAERHVRHSDARLRLFKNDKS